MNSLRKYTVEELLLIYYNQSKIATSKGSSLNKVEIMQNYDDYAYSNSMYSDSGYSNYSYSDSDYSNSSYYNASYSDNDYTNYLYYETDSYSSPGGRFYSEYSDYSDYSDDSYGDSGYSYADYSYSRSSSKGNRYKYLDDPFRSFWFVAASTVLLLLPLIALVLAKSFPNKESSILAFFYGDIYYLFPPLAFGLGIFIPKMFSHRRYLRHSPYLLNNPFKSFSFVLAFILFAGAFWLGFIVPKSGIFLLNLNIENASTLEFRVLRAGAFYWLVIGVMIIICKIKNYIRFYR